MTPEEVELVEDELAEVKQPESRGKERRRRRRLESSTSVSSPPFASSPHTESSSVI